MQNKPAEPGEFRSAGSFLKNMRYPLYMIEQMFYNKFVRNSFALFWHLRKIDIFVPGRANAGYVCSRPEGRQGLHDVFFRAVVQNAHTHFLPACDREFRNAYRIKFRAEPFFRVQAEILRLCRFFFLSGHKHHPVSVCPENKKFCIKSLPVPAKLCKKKRAFRVL